MDDSFGETLRALRQAAGLTLDDLVRRTGISKSYLSQLETGAYETPSDEKVIQLARALDVAPGALFEKILARRRSLDGGQAREIAALKSEFAFMRTDKPPQQRNGHGQSLDAALARAGIDGARLSALLEHPGALDFLQALCRDGEDLDEGDFELITEMLQRLGSKGRRGR